MKDNLTLYLFTLNNSWGVITVKGVSFKISLYFFSNYYKMENFFSYINNKNLDCCLNNIIQSNILGSIFELMVLFGSFVKLYLPFIYSFLFTLSFTLFYLDDWKLSKNNILKYIQIFTFLSIPAIIMFLFYNITLYMDIICMVKEGNSDVDLHGHISVDKEAGKALGQGLNTIGSQIGLGATVAGVSGAVGKAIIKSPVPPIQKAAIIVGAGVAGGVIHVGASAINRALSKGYSTNPNTSINSNNVNNLNDNISKFLSDSSDNYSDLMILILSIDALTSVCLSLVIIMFIMILFKFFLNENIKLNLSGILGNKLNNTLQYYLVKLIKLNKMTSNIYIIATLIILLISLAFDCYFITQLYNNLDLFIDLHINKK